MSKVMISSPGINPRPTSSSAQGKQTAHRTGVLQAKTVAAPRKKQPLPAPPVYRPQPTPKVLQRKVTDAQQCPPRFNHPPAAPAVYRPQPVPKVLQRKAAPVQPQAAGAPKRAHAAPPTCNPRPTPGCVQPKKAEGRQPSATGLPSRFPALPAHHPVPQQSKVGPLAGPRAQPTARPERGPTAAGLLPKRLPPTPGRTPRFTAIQGKFKNGVPGHYQVDPKRAVLNLQGTQTNLKSGSYNFVTVDGVIYVAPESKAGHPMLSGGADVDYAGVLYVQGGELLEWSNGSGHYLPDAASIADAGLPVNLFTPYLEWYEKGWRCLRLRLTDDRKPLDVSSLRGISLVPLDTDYQRLEDENEGTGGGGSGGKCLPCIIQ
jgi:hypothetical protein